MLNAGRVTLKNNHRQNYSASMEAGAPRFTETDEPPAAAPRPNMLPDGSVSKGDNNIHAARLIDPARCYRHDVIGDVIEVGALAAKTGTGAIQTPKLA